MSNALLVTKFFAPPRPAHDIARPLLIQRLDEGLSCKLTLVCAAAGFGKSTLISHWAQGCPYPSAWLSLDEEDRDPSCFLEYLVTSIGEISQAVGSGLATLLRTSPPTPVETVLTLLVNQLSKIRSKLVLVLDDYHLAESAPVNDVLMFLIDNMPAQLHVVVASREEPVISLGKLRVDGQLIEIRQQDLRFAKEEAIEFFKQDLQIQLSPAQVHALEERTEGWISGLKLAAISLRSHKDPEQFIASFTGGHHFVQDYLIEEVLHQQPADVQSFLLRTSVLDRLCGSLCDAVLEDHGGQQILNQLHNANLFIVPLDTERRWYRYHHLFAELLRQRLGQKESAEPLHLRASQWYEAQGLEVEAFQQATLSNDLACAIRLVGGQGMPLYFRGLTAPVVQWLSTLQLATLNAYPSLWVAHAWALLFAGHPGQVEEKLLGAEAAIRTSTHDMSTTDTLGQIAALRGWLAVYRNDADSIYANASLALELLDSDNRPVRTAAHCAVGVAQMFRGEWGEASLAFAKVIGAGRSSGNLMFAAVASTALAGIQVTENKLHLAAATYRDVIQMIADPNHVLGFEAHLGLAKILYDWNQLDEAESLVLVCSELVARTKSQSEIGADLMRVRLMQARNASAAANALLDEIDVRSDALTKQGSLSDRMRELADLRVSQWIRNGEIQMAADVALRYQLPVGLAKALVAQGKGEEALRAIENHRRSMEEQGRLYDALKSVVVQARVLLALEQTDKALKVLRGALQQAQSQGSVRIFADEGEVMNTLLTQLQNETGLAHFVSQILAAFGTQTPPEKQITVAQAPWSHLLQNAFSARELEILRLIQEGHSNLNISERLFVSLSTVKWHNQNIFSKLDVQRRTEAVARALQLKLL